MWTRYNVMSYNLVTLHDIIKKFKTLEDEHFLVRMDPKEAGIYGDQQGSSWWNAAAGEIDGEIWGGAGLIRHDD